MGALPARSSGLARPGPAPVQNALQARAPSPVLTRRPALYADHLAPRPAKRWPVLVLAELGRLAWTVAFCGAVVAVLWSAG